MKDSVKHWIDVFKKKLCDSDKCPSEGSLKTYAYAISWLQERVEFPDGNIPNCEDVLEYLENAKVTNTRRAAVYTAIKKYYSACDDKCNCEKYSGPLVRAKQALDEHYAKQRRTQKQSKNWIDQCDLKKHAAKLRNEIFTFDKHNFWSKEQFQKAQLAFILLFHLRYPIRRDLATVRWNNNKKFEWGSDDNYIDQVAKKIVLQKHKSSKYKGTVELKLSRVLWRIWALLKKQQVKRGFKSGGMILLNKHYKYMTPNNFSSWLVREMKTLPGCGDKKIGCMILRHSIITHKRRNEMTNIQKEKFAKECLHSEKTNNQYRVHE